MLKLIKSQPTGRIIALGFFALILLGSFLLMLPFSIQDGVEVRYIDALYTSTSAVCVTGLIAIDAGDTFTPLGQFILASLIQIGGLGVTSVGAGIILAMRKKINLKTRTLIKDGSNLSSAKGIVKFLKSVFLTTLTFEFLGAILSFWVFVKDYPIKEAIGISLFHSVAAFNNSGFDILGNYQNLIPYQDNVILNLVTCGLIFFGGIGFLAIKDVINNRFNWKKFSMHTKVVFSMSITLIIIGTLLLKVTEDITWLGALFNSVSARTAGFSTFPLSEFSNAGLFVLIILMFIGASPGSTGGGIKTSTLFILLQSAKSAATNKSEKGFHYALPKESFKKAGIITLMSISIVILGTYLMIAFEPHLRFIDAFFEVTSAFGTVGLSTGITTTLSDTSKLLTIIIMYIGRLGPLTIATLWYFKNEERVSYPEGNIAIG